MFLVILFSFLVFNCVGETPIRIQFKNIELVIFSEADFSQMRKNKKEFSGLQHSSGGNMSCMKMVDSLNVINVILKCAVIVQPRLNLRAI